MNSLEDINFDDELIKRFDKAYVNNIGRWDFKNMRYHYICSNFYKDLELEDLCNYYKKNVGKSISDWTNYYITERSLLKKYITQLSYHEKLNFYSYMKTHINIDKNLKKINCLK